MPHCPPELLTDVADVLTEVRAWTGVTERRSGVFYVRRQPFFHFHLLEGGRRRADVKGASEWSHVDVPRPLTVTARRALLRELQARYRERLGPLPARARGTRTGPAPSARRAVRASGQRPPSSSFR